MVRQSAADIETTLNFLMGQFAAESIMLDGMDLDESHGLGVMIYSIARELERRELEAYHAASV